jgi:biopolymer transport protein ExbB
MNTVETLKNLMVAGGAGWVLWLLFALSIGSIAVFVERWLFFRRKDTDVRALAAELDAHLSDGEVDEAIGVLKSLESVGAAVVRAGLKLADRGAGAVEKGMKSAMAVERKDLEARLAFLGTLGNNAPFIGLFGTVIGVILAFDVLAQDAAMAASGGVASAGVMAAVAEALVATAVGIGVALPAVAAYNYFQRRISVFLEDAETLSNLVLAYLSSDAPSPSASQSMETIDDEAGAAAPTENTEV